MGITVDKLWVRFYQENKYVACAESHTASRKEWGKNNQGEKKEAKGEGTGFQLKSQPAPATEAHGEDQWEFKLLEPILCESMA